jgi:hypothetical protein
LEAASIIGHAAHTGSLRATSITALFQVVFSKASALSQPDPRALLPHKTLKQPQRNSGPSCRLFFPRSSLSSVPDTIWIHTSHSGGTATTLDTSQVSVHRVDGTLTTQLIAPRGFEGDNVMTKLANDDRGLSPGLVFSAVVYGDTQKRDDSSLSHIMTKISSRHADRGLEPWTTA